MAIIKGFIKNLSDTLLPITRAELVLDKSGSIAFHSPDFVVNESNSYGLISYEALKAIQDALSGIENDGILTVLQNLLTSINKGLKIGDQSLNFYEDNKAVETNIISSNPNVLEIALKNEEEGKRNLEFNIRTIRNKDLTLKEDNKIIKSIEVDTYGRVTDATQDVIYDSELPQILSGKILTNCTTPAVGDSDDALVNRSYVDSQFNKANQVATGALIFGGTIRDKDNADDKLTVSDNKYKYYKVTAPESFTLNSDQIDGGDNSITVKLGDTLIITDQQKYIHIPSGDDVAMISVGGGKEDTISLLVQSLIFSDVFTVTHHSNYTEIDISKINSSETPNVSFTPGEGHTLGTLTIGNDKHELKIPPYSTYSLKLDSNKLKFEKDGSTSTTITFSGLGISVTGSGNDINIRPILDSKYFSILEDGTISAVIADPIKEQDGLIDRLTLLNYASNAHAIYSQFEKIENSLTDKTQKYYYGSLDLKDAIQIE